MQSSDDCGLLRDTNTTRSHANPFCPSSDMAETIASLILRAAILIALSSPAGVGALRDLPESAAVTVPPIAPDTLISPPFSILKHPVSSRLRLSVFVYASAPAPVTEIETDFLSCAPMPVTSTTVAPFPAIAATTAHANIQFFTLLSSLNF